MQLSHGAILAYDCERVAIVLPSYDYSESQYPEVIVAHHASGLDAKPVKPGIEYVPYRTCHDKGGTGSNGQEVFYCDECGCVLSLYDSDGTNTLCTRFIYDYPRYCPECGRKVVDR